MADRKDGPKAAGDRPSARSATRTARPRRAGRTVQSVSVRRAPDRTPEWSGTPRSTRAPSRSPDPPITTTHRNALLATLSPEQLPVAEQLLRGGMPAVRAAVELQNKNAAAQGRPTIDPATIERIAEDLLARTNLALWKDRAAGAIGAGRSCACATFRAVVTSAKTVSLDDEARVAAQGASDRS